MRVSCCVLVWLILASVTMGAPIVDGGWASDQTSVPGPSAGSPYVYSLSFSSAFSITDAFVAPPAGDIFEVWDNGVLILTTAFGTPAVRTPFLDGNPAADAAWVSAAFTHGQVVLGPGNHSIQIFSNSLPGGQPAGFFARIDTLPEPTSLLAWGLLTGVGLVGYRLRRRKQAA